MELQITTSKEKKTMRKLYSFALMGFVALVLAFGTVGKSFAQVGLFNYTPYPTIAINHEDFYPDFRYLVPDALAGGERLFLVPIFVRNRVDVAKNPNTQNGQPKMDNERIPGVDGQLLEPIRSFEFQLMYADQSIELDDDNPQRGSPIVTLGPTTTTNQGTSWASPFYITYTEQSANDDSNPFLKRIRVAGASEVPLPLSNLAQNPDPTQAKDILLYLRFKIKAGWLVNATLLQLDTARFAGRPGDPQYDPNNWRRGNLGGPIDQPRGRIRVEITDQPAFEFRPLSDITTVDNKNFDLLRTLISDPAVPSASVPTTQLQVRDAIGNTRLTNISIITDQPWLKVGLSPGQRAHDVFIPQIDYTSSAGSEERALYISAEPSGLIPGIYYGYVTLTSEGASNSPARIRVKFIVRSSPDEPIDNGGSGIGITIDNACNCTNTLRFGTGVGATDGIDELYGEDIFTATARQARENNPNQSQRCWAYFEPRNLDADLRFQDPDFAGTVRDIRSNLGDSTIIYRVSFNAGGDNCYPVTVCMDPQEFPVGARVIVRDTLNGSIFAVNMREATLDGTGVRCFTIRDPRISTFEIEYTRGSTGTVATLLTHNWNFISLPVIPPDPRANAIFPNATGNPFEYAAFGGWTASDELEYGRGYMIHYGQFINSDSLVSGVRSKTIRNIRVNNGWNAVGATSYTTCIDGGITFGPAGGGPVPQLISQVFEFVATKGYFTAAYLIPGQGYFLRVDNEGVYNVDPVAGCKAVAPADAEVKHGLVMMTVRDAAQNGQELFFGNTMESDAQYALPPITRDFDARFASNNGYISTASETHTVAIASENYPVALAFENVAGTVEVRNEMGNLIGSTTGNGTVVISDASVKNVVVSYKQSTSADVAGFSLEANVPNPFSSMTKIGFTVPAETFVTITVTNSLGQNVATVLSQNVAAGRHTVDYDGAQLSNGTYFYTIRAANFAKTIKMTVQK